MRNPFAKRADARSTTLVRDVICDCCTECGEPCALSLLPAGIRATIVRFVCPQGDACRLRVLGVFEGTPVNIIDDRNGLVLDVRGTRVAISASLAAAIIGIPLI